MPTEIPVFSEIAETAIPFSLMYFATAVVTASTALSLLSIRVIVHLIAYIHSVLVPSLSAVIYWV